MSATTQFDAIYTAVVATIKKGKLAPTDLIIIATSAMTIVQTYPSLSGAEKKAIVIEVVQRLVNTTTLFSEEDKAAANALIAVALPPTIDAVVGAYNHTIDLAKQKKGCFSCLA